MKITCHLCGKVVVVAKGEVADKALFFCSSDHFTHWVRLTGFRGLVAIKHGEIVINTESR